MPISKGEMIFNPETHTYTLDGEEYISVTRLMKKHGLSPDYSNVSEETLQAAAARGSFVHGEIERYIKDGDAGCSAELYDFIDLCEDNGLKPTKSEFIVYNAEYKVAGTVDLMGLTADMQGFVGDIKTTSTLHKEALEWQLGLYAFLGEMTVSKYYGFHLRSNGKSKLVEVKGKSKDEVVRLLEAEKRGDTFQSLKAEVVIANEDKLVKAQETIDFYQRQLDNAKAEMESLKGFLITAMKKNDIKKLESDRLLITYIAPTTRQTIDGARLKKELPDVAKEYAKTSEVKETVRITLRGER